MRLPAALFTFLILVSCAPAPAPPAAAPPAGPAENEINAASLTAHLRMLSSDLFEGRAPATRGGKLAEEYLAAQMAALGLQPAGDDGTFFQQVPIVESTVERTFALSVPGNTYRYFQDVVAFSGLESARVQVQGDVVFVGYGVNAPELKWNDYAGVDVQGKWVMIMVNDPPAPADEPTLFGGPALTYYGRWTYKYEEAARQGAAGALLIHTDESATYPWQVVQTSWSGTQYSLPPEAGTPALGIKAWMTESAARDLAKRGGKDLDALRKSASARGFKAVNLGVRAAATLQQRSARKTASNVVAKLAGTNDQQAIVFTSHWDHFGIRDPQPGDARDADRIFNGAYDNASGCAGLIELARAMTRAPQKPGRSMLFVFVTAEESGLLGSEYFVSHPPMPPARMAANLNVDGLNYLGPTRDMVQLGSDRSSLGPMLEAILKQRGRTLGKDLHPERGYFFRSDHFPFAKLGVPALSISEPKEFTGPTAAALLKKQEDYNGKDYHQPTDQYDPSWDFSGAVDDLKVLAQLAWQIAAAPEMPKYNDGDQFANARK
jgi:Zn-dependent M28 family amino/carboxypeptidase